MADLVAFEEQLSLMSVNLPAAPFEVALDSAVSAAREVCTRVPVWKFYKNYGQADAVVNVGELYDAPLHRSNIYGVFAGENYQLAGIADVVSVESVRTVESEPREPRELQQIMREQLFRQFPQASLGLRRIDGEPLYFYVDEERSDFLAIYLVPWPDRLSESGGVRVVQSLAPKPNVSVMDARVWGNIKDAVFHGAMQRMMTMQDSAWTDLELAAYHSRQFVFKIEQLRHRDNLGVGRVPLRVTPRPWV